ncbi:alpha/beta hydrolase family protein [Spirosoma pollinicola]|uniref:Dienelactone hydrolase domain-containing protein n=1 Tax=Spirosoma pollinicola TaxID=2057025 RepID=A0A2K8YTR3_9BACT|nr:hypothetical protein [Spirosoma pollinicola]AUD01011.1 hypothetical protein CWM47_03745 [Spirosoma pollinicola]
MKFFQISAYLIFSAINSLYAQSTPRAVGSYAVFTIPFEGDSVTFAVVAKPGELKAKKSVFLFRQGSLPIPLFTINPKNNRPSLTELPISCYDHESDYYSIMIAKPGVPVIENDAYLDTLFTTRNNPKPAMYPPQYQAHNYLDYYVRQTNAVLKFVLQQPWADAKRVVLAGGSEGYGVAIKTAYANPTVTHLIAFSGFLDGRQQGIIREERMKGYTGEYTQEQAQQSVEGLQQQWSQICADSLNTSAKVGDPNRTHYSFSIDFRGYLLALTIPILIIYGTADIGATSNDVLPLEFAKRGKKNLEIKAYPNHDHTFYKLTFDDKGKVISKVYNGVAVEKDYFQWLKEH